MKLVLVEPKNCTAFDVIQLFR